MQLRFYVNFLIEMYIKLLLEIKKWLLKEKTVIL